MKWWNDQQPNSDIWQIGRVEPVADLQQEGGEGGEGQKVQSGNDSNDGIVM